MRPQQLHHNTPHQHTNPGADHCREQKFGHSKSRCSHPLSNTQHTTTPPPTTHTTTPTPHPHHHSGEDRTGMRSMPQAGSSTTQKHPHTQVSPQDPTACRTPTTPQPQTHPGKPMNQHHHRAFHPTTHPQDNNPGPGHIMTTPATLTATAASTPRCSLERR